VKLQEKYALGSGIGRDDWPGAVVPVVPAVKVLTRRPKRPFVPVLWNERPEKKAGPRTGLAPVPGPNYWK
jgi:hypothetical protein